MTGLGRIGLDYGTLVRAFKTVFQPGTPEAIDVSATEYERAGGFTVYVGGTGNVKVDGRDGGVGVVYTAIPTGTFVPVTCKKVYSDGTTATNLVAQY